MISIMLQEDNIMKYVKPQIEITEADLVLLIASGPGAGDIGSPSVRYNSKSVWDDEASDNTLFNIKEESYEDKVYE